MASLVPGFAYDIFISYRQKDNKHLSAGQAGEGWVTEFVKHLKEELDATFKQDISIYFDANPHDGLGETHHVDKSLVGKLKCLILIPVISRTYCDPQSFAWQQEFLVFRDQAKADSFGLEIRLANQNVASRILPVQIHELNSEDQDLFERENGGPLRAIPLVFKSQGVNRPLTPSDSRAENSNKTLYRDQINKTANAVEEILGALKELHHPAPRKEIKSVKTSSTVKESRNTKWLWLELARRNVFRAGFAYLVFALTLRQLTSMISDWLQSPKQITSTATWILLALFPIALIIAWLYEMSPGGLIRTNSQESASNPFSPSQKKPFTGVLTAVVIVLLLVLMIIKPRYEAPGANAIQRSIAVVPFENRSEHSKDEYLAVTLSDEIITRLANLSELIVHKAKGDNYDSIYKRMGVITVLTGSVQRSGDTVRINAQLRELPKGNTIWAQTFTRRATDILAIQTDAAKRIAQILKVKVSEVERARLEHRPTENTTAYDYYLRGLRLYKRYKKDSNALAIKQFKTALELDDKFANAYAGLGDAYSQMSTRFALGVSWIDSSVTASKKAIQLNPNLSEAYKALANAYSKSRRYDTAIVLLQKALQLNPNYSAAVGNLGTCYMLVGDLPEALRWQKRGAGLDPQNWIPFQITGWIYRWMDDLPNAEMWLKKSLELDSTVWDTYEQLAYCLVGQGKNDEALLLIPGVIRMDSMDTRALETAGLIAHFAGDKVQAKKYFLLSIRRNSSFKEDPVTVSPIGLSQILMSEGNPIDAEVYLTRTLEINRKAIESGSLSGNPPFYISGIHAIRGERNKSLEWLKRAIDSRWIDYAQVTHGPWFVKYRDDPEFVSIISSLREKTEQMREKAKGI